MGAGRADPKLEVAGVALGDSRLASRAQLLVERIASAPSLSFPKLFPDDAELEACYRFLNNPSVTLERLVEPHIESTVRRVVEAGEALIVHDSSEFTFSGEAGREGLTPLRGKRGRPGFLGHFALALAADGTRRPLGVVGVSTLVRKPPTARRKAMTRTQRRDSPDSEFARWGKLVSEVEKRVSGAASPVHVMDREGDDYRLLEQLSQGSRFVIRLHHDRSVRVDEGVFAISDVLARAQSLCEREVLLSKRAQGDRSPSSRKRYPAREARTARLRISSARVRIRRPHHCPPGTVPHLDVNVVRVFEVDCPAGVEPVEWHLLTSEAIDTAADVERVVDIYRARWGIEEYFKALKTGCAYEKRQLESKQALLCALGLLIPVAWHLLLVRSVARTAPTAPARAVLTARQLEVLRHCSRKPLPSEPTAQDVLLAIAKLGGHIRWSGPPGWQVLGHGYQVLLDYERGWTARERQLSKMHKTS